jgi:exopolysaccharide biosynthesis polyprenyl glycosylphosphotransferase
MVHALRRQMMTNALKAFDVLLVACALGLAHFAATYSGGKAPLGNFLASEVRVRNVLVFGLLLLAAHITFRASGVYRSHRLSQRHAEISDLVHASSLVALLVAAVSALETERLTPWFLLVFWGLLTASTLGSRLLLRLALERFRVHGHNLRNVLMVGTNPRAVAFAHKLTEKHGLGYRLIGFADEPWEGLKELRGRGEKPVCRLEEVPQYLRANVVDEVVIGLPMQSSYQQASRIVTACEEQGIIVRVLPGLFDLKVARSRADEVDGEPVLTLFTVDAAGWPGVMKRLLDVTVAAILVVVLAPLLLVVALLVKLTSPGPVFVFLPRVGLNKRPFRLMKFRTAPVGAEEALNPVKFPARRASREGTRRAQDQVTALGKFLRDTCFDEVPQLLNVIAGSMSLVGPRPLPVQDYEGFDQDWQRRRFSVRPGITCLWQLDDPRQVSFERWMELDLEYVDTWSLWLDLKILFRTVPAVLKGAGAA